MLDHRCFSHQHPSGAQQPVPREDEHTLGDPTVSPPGFLFSGQCQGESYPARKQYRKQKAWPMYMSPCGLWSQLHPTFKPTQAARATGNGRGYIYSHTVFIQRCCFAQITVNFFIGRGHVHSLRASWGAAHPNHST